MQDLKSITVPASADDIGRGVHTSFSAPDNEGRAFVFEQSESDDAKLVDCSITKRSTTVTESGRIVVLCANPRYGLHQEVAVK